MDNENANENENENGNSSDNSNDTSRISPKRKLINKGKKAAKNLVKDIANAFLRALRNALKVKTILILLVFILVAVVVSMIIDTLSRFFVFASENNISSYISTLDTDSNTAKFYKQTGSLLLVTDDDVKKMADNFFEETEKTDKILYELMKENYKTGWLSDFFNIPEVRIEQGRTLYEHLLNSERYNFNKIKWVKYTRSAEDGTPEMQTDSETRLTYPKDSKNTTLESFANQVQPYLQNYIIPYSMYSGLVSDSKIKVPGYNVDIDDESTSKQFAYDMLKSAYHDMQVNQYNIKSHTKVTENTVYDLLAITVTHTIKYTADGEDSSYSKSNVTTRQSCVSETSEPKVIKEYDDWNIQYCIKYANLFDKKIINEYQYTEYDLNNDPDDQTISRAIYKDQNYIDYENGKFNIPDSAYEDIYDGNGNLIGRKAKYTIEMKKGYTDTTTSTWKDTLAQISHEERAYTVSDVQEALGDTATLSANEKNYYKLYEYDADKNSSEYLNLFDIANAQKSVYEGYLLAGEEYSDNIGYPRPWFAFGLNTLRHSVESIASSERGWKYFYGNSLGIKEATIQTSNNLTDVQMVPYSGAMTGEWVWPVPESKKISSPYGYRIHPVYKTKKLHTGIDISGNGKETYGIYASKAGKVTKIVDNITGFRNNSYGNRVVIDHGEGFSSSYNHLKYGTILVKVGDTVEKGQQIATLGNTGTSTGPHLHYEILFNGKHQNPMNYVSNQ